MTRPPGDGLEGHLQHQAEIGRKFFWHRLRWRAVKGHLPPAGPFRLLDVGAGTGVLGDILAVDRPEATYLFDEPLASLEQRLEGRFGSDANHRTQPRWRDVDVVTLLDVIEHLDDPGAMLADICRHCLPGTTVVITVPGSERLWSQWDVALGHHRRYTKGTLQALLADLPLQVEEVSWLFPELTPAAQWRAWRHPPRSDVAAEPLAEFPLLPGPVNTLLHYVGIGPVALRRWMPFGTSLIAAARVLPQDSASEGP